MYIFRVEITEDEFEDDVEKSDVVRIIREILEDSSMEVVKVELLEETESE